VKGDTVVDLFAGTGTLGRVAPRCGVDALMLELSRETVDNILADQPETEEVYY
jgi:16S rRNA G966 N2-methylase RsmD